MKFGKRLLELVNPEWSDLYIAYKSLKKDLKHLTSQRMSDSSAAEGAFLTALLGSIHQVRDVCVCVEILVAGGAAPSRPFPPHPLPPTLVLAFL